MVQYSDNEGLLTMYFFMLRECAEYFISRLDNVTCFELYKSSYGLLQLFSPPLRAGDASTTRSESIYDLLCLLNHLSTKEFAFSEDYTQEVSYSFEAEIAVVLLCGLEIIVPVVTVDTLEGYPATEEKYFSFIAFLTSAFFNQMIRWIYDSAKGKEIWLQLIQHLLWGVTSIRASSGREALQALQSIAANQFQWASLQMVVNSQQQNRQQLVHAQKQLNKMQGLDAQLQSELLLPVIDQLAQILLSKSPGSNKPVAEVCWDRVDSFANTFITFIALDPTRFHQVAGYLVSCQAVSLQPTLGDCLLQLTTARNVILTDVSKPNRIKFVQNFREFCVRIKSLAMR